MVAFVVVSSMFIAPEWHRGQARLKHVAPRFGEVPVEGALVVSNVPRQRVTARSGLTGATLLLGITGAASVVTALLAPKVVLTHFQLNSPDMGPGFGWDNTVAPMGGYRVVAVAILLVALPRPASGHCIGQSGRPLLGHGHDGPDLAGGQRPDRVRPQRGARHRRVSATARCTCRTPGDQRLRRPRPCWTRCVVDGHPRPSPESRPASPRSATTARSHARRRLGPAAGTDRPAPPRDTLTLRPRSQQRPETDDRPETLAAGNQ
jgi:hypothetical protein